MATRSQSAARDEASTEPDPVDYATAYASHLQQAVRALTAAARLRPAHVETTEDGTRDEHAETAGPMDWAGFVTAAVAGAAANIGSIETILAGSPPESSEVDGVRRLLYSAVGGDAGLWRHRTEPLEVTIYLEEIITDHTTAWRQYDEARIELDHRYEAAARATSIDRSRYLWFYDRDQTGAWAPRDPVAPAWTLEAWRAQVPETMPPQPREHWEALVTGARLDDFTGEPYATTTLAKSPAAAAELDRLLDERDTRLAAITHLGKALEEQKRREWTAYAEAIKTRVLVIAAATLGLEVPVRVSIDMDTLRPSSTRPRSARVSDYSSPLEARLVEAAVMDTPSPQDLPGTPLQRLEQHANARH